jgi:hypothetical protein
VQAHRLGYRASTVVCGCHEVTGRATGYWYLCLDPAPAVGRDETCRLGEDKARQGKTRAKERQVQACTCPALQDKNHAGDQRPRQKPRWAGETWDPNVRFLIGRNSATSLPRSFAPRLPVPSASLPAPAETKHAEQSFQTALGQWLPTRLALELAPTRDHSRWCAH